MIAGAVLIPTVGWLGNRLGNRNLFVLRLLVFVGSSILCGIAWSGPMLIFFRVLQGMGSGPITPMAMVFLNELQRLTDYTPAQAGHAVLPGALGMALTTPWAGCLADKIDRRYVVLGGLTMVALASYWFSFITLERPMDWVIWMIVGRYVTIGFIFTPINAASMMLLPT